MKNEEQDALWPTAVRLNDLLVSKGWVSPGGQCKPRPMSEAPLDGTVILVFESVGKIPSLMYFEKDGILTGWADYPTGEVLEAKGLRGWLPCPTYTGEAV